MTAQRRKKLMEEKTLKFKIEGTKYEWKMKCKIPQKFFTPSVLVQNIFVHSNTMHSTLYEKLRIKKHKMGVQRSKADRYL
jgi:hypothetical protein